MTQKLIMYVRKSSESEDRQELSIPAQKRELKELAVKKGLAVAAPYLEEARSAKTPGRPVFADLMQQLQKGKADGILCWKLDRLARNPVDGGALMWALGEGRIKQIVTPERTYSGTGDDKLLMSIIFGMATKYSDDLSDNIKRGNRAALEAGRWPGLPKLGYVREPKTKELIPDPERYETVRELWRMVLDGQPPLDVLATARETLELRTPNRGRLGGALLSKSGFYRLLRDPFYTGLMRHGGQTYSGGHAPMITVRQFEKVQDLIDEKIRLQPRAKTLEFAYRGLIACGRCGAMITARHMKNRYGSAYTYYFCCRKERRYKYCPKRALEESQITRNLAAFIDSLVLPEPYVRAVLGRVAERASEEGRAVEETRTSLRRQLADRERRLVRARKLLIDDHLSATDYEQERAELTREKVDLEQRLAGLDENPGLIEPLEQGFSAVDLARSEFHQADAEHKRKIVRSLTCNLTMKDKILLIQAKEPYASFARWSSIPKVCSLLNDVDNFCDAVASGKIRFS